MFANGQKEALESLINMSVNKTGLMNEMNVSTVLPSFDTPELKRKTHSESVGKSNRKKFKKEMNLDNSLTRVALSTSKETSKPGGNWQCWSHEEEVFLVGAVLDRFFARGSLSSTKKETARGNKKHSWDSIKETYDLCFKKYSQLIGVDCPPSRTENALSRHYKVMKERCIGKGAKNRIDFKALYHEWEISYNKKYNLIVEPAYDTPETKKKEGDMITGGPSQSKGRWNFHDEVILIGVVVETFFQRGSLSSSHKERKKNESDFWENLHSLYEAVRDRYNRAHGLGMIKTTRSHQALARHFKVMKVKLIESKGSLNLTSFYSVWEKTYHHYYISIVEERKKREKTEKVASTGFAFHQFHKSMRNREMERKEQELEAQFLPQKATLRNMPGTPNPMLLEYLRSPSQQNIPITTLDANPMAQYTLPRTASFGSLFAGVQSTTSPGAIINLQAIKNMQNSNELPQPEVFRNILTPGSEMLDFAKMQEFLPLISPGATPTPSEAGDHTAMPAPVLTQTGNATTMWIPYTVVTPQPLTPPKSPGPAPTQNFS